MSDSQTAGTRTELVVWTVRGIDSGDQPLPAYVFATEEKARLDRGLYGNPERYCIIKRTITEEIVP